MKVINTLVLMQYLPDQYTTVPSNKVKTTSLWATLLLALGR